MRTVHYNVVYTFFCAWAKDDPKKIKKALKILGTDDANPITWDDIYRAKAEYTANPLTDHPPKANKVPLVRMCAIFDAFDGEISFDEAFARAGLPSPMSEPYYRDLFASKIAKNNLQ